MEQFFKWNNFQIEQIWNWTILNLNKIKIDFFWNWCFLKYEQFWNWTIFRNLNKILKSEKKLNPETVICNKIEAEKVKARTRKLGDEVSGPAHVSDSWGVDALADGKGVK
jgi:hypothetical protein